MQNIISFESPDDLYSFLHGVLVNSLTITLEQGKLNVILNPELMYGVEGVQAMFEVDTQVLAENVEKSKESEAVLLCPLPSEDGF